MSGSLPQRTDLATLLDAAEQRIADLEAERQAVIDCVNLYGDATLHWSLDAAGLLKPEVAE